MSVNQAYDSLNRQINNPSYSQIPIAYNKKIAYENNIDNNIPYDNTYPYSVLIDSRDRNSDKEEPGYYTIKLNSVFKDVHAIELIGARLPNPCYNVTKDTNKIYFQETVDQVKQNQCYQSSIQPGHYNVLTLASSIEESMNNVGKSKYKVEYNHITKQFTIISDNLLGSGIFNLIFTSDTEYINDRNFMDQEHITTNSCGQILKHITKNIVTGSIRNIYIKGSIGKVIGFKPLNLIGLLSYTGQYIHNLNPFGYLGLFVNDYDRIKSVNKSIDGSFCIIPVDNETGSYNINTRDVDNAKFVKIFNPPIKEICKFTIKFVSPDGTIYDFHGQDNMLLFEVHCNFGLPIIRNNNQLDINMTKIN